MNTHFRISRILEIFYFKQISIITIVVLIIFLSCIQSQRKPHEGTWNLVSMQRISGDTLEWIFPGDITGSDMKMWTKDHFSFVGRFKRDTTIVDNFGGGTYTLNGNQYEETILYAANSDNVGSKIKILLEVKGDSLIQTWPLDDNWQLDKSNYYIEKYIRLE